MKVCTCSTAASVRLTLTVISGRCAVVIASNPSHAWTRKLWCDVSCVNASVCQPVVTYTFTAIHVERCLRKEHGSTGSVGDRGHHHIGDNAAQRGQGPILSGGVHSVREKDDEKVASRIYPNRSAGKSRVSEARRVEEVTGACSTARRGRVPTQMLW